MNKLILFLLLIFQSTFTFAATENGHWHAGIGDPTIFGWVTVVVYLIAVFRCIVKAKDSKKFGGNYQFWLYLGALLIFLGINKQLDLQSWLTEVVRESAHTHGWYEQRKSVQILFIGLLGLAMIIALVSLRLFLANSWRHNKLTWVGVVLLCTFILIRAASFHHIDIFINQSIWGYSVNVILEIGAILLIILGTFYNKKSENLLAINTFPMNRYADISKEGDDVQCPQCGVQPIAKTIDGRIFKCRRCGNKFMVRVMNG